MVDKNNRILMVFYLLIVDNPSPFKNACENVNNQPWVKIGQSLSGLATETKSFTIISFRYGCEKVVY